MTEITKNLFFLCAKWISRDNILASILEDEELKAIVKDFGPRYGNVARKTVTSYVAKLDANVVARMKLQLSYTSPVSIPTEVWSDESANSYSSFTAHFLTQEWKIRSYILGCTLLHARHTGFAFSLLLPKIL